MLLLTGGLVAASACTTEDPAPGQNASDVSAASPPGGASPESGGVGATSSKSTPGAAASRSDSVTLGPVRSGIATFYDADGSGNCSFEPSPDDLMVVAPNKDRYYDGSAICGACMRVTGPKGTVTVRVTDSCPDDGGGDCGSSGADLDLSAEAFAAIDAPDRGVSHVSWQLVPCDVTGPMRFHFKPGSSRSWTAIQVLNHRLPVAKLELATDDGGFTELRREDDDYFIADSGVGRTPNGLRLRVTSSTGASAFDTLPGVEGGATIDGTQQFP